MTLSRLILALLIAPAVPALAICLPSLFFGSSVESTFSIFLFACAVTYAHAVLLGVPVATILIKRSTLGRSRVLGVASLIGAIPFAAWTVYQELTMPPGAGATINGVPHRVDGQLTTAGWISSIEGILMVGVIGAITGIVWWWIAGVSANKQMQSDAAKAAPLI